MFNRIVVAVDDSCASDRVVDVVKSMATGTDLTVILVHARSRKKDEGGPEAPHSATSAKQLLDRYCKQIGASAIRVEPIVLEGDPGPAIVECAAVHKGQAVVTSRNECNTNGESNSLSNSVSGYVIQHATCPVIVVP